MTKLPSLVLKDEASAVTFHLAAKELNLSFGICWILIIPLYQGLDSDKD